MYLQNRNKSYRCRKQIYGEDGARQGRDKLGEWDWHMHTATYRIDNKDLLYSTGNSTQYAVMTCMEKNLEEWKQG